jgi:drug/metabolite transporter (DMT)-like permease
VETYLGEVFSVGCALLWAVAVIFLRTASNSVPAVELNILKNTLGTGLFALTLLILGPSQFAGLTGLTLALLGLSAVLGITIADTCFLKALNLLGAGRNAVLDCLYSPFVIILSVLFLEESFGWKQAMGFILIIGGVFMATSSSHKDPISQTRLWRGLGYGTLSMLFMAIGVVISKPILTETSPVAVSAWRLWIGLLGGIVWILISGRTKRSMAVFRGPLPWVSITMSAVLGTWLALIVWMAGFKYTEASTASILNQTSVIFIVILAAVFLREPVGWKKVAGIILGFSGIVTVFLS